MATKIRLQRHGKKGKPFYHIVVADSRSKRDGKYIEQLGVYNPISNPATIELNFERALHWLKTGATPTETMHAMLAYKGVNYKHHLDKGVLKGAFSQEEADKRFEEWLAAKEGKVQTKRDSIAKKNAAELARLFDLEAKKNAEIAEKVAAKYKVEEPVAEVIEEVAEEVKNEPTAEAVETTVEDTATTTTEETSAEETENTEEKAPEA
jgi:small subunit ribosomal protein S16